MNILHYYSVVLQSYLSSSTPLLSAFHFPGKITCCDLFFMTQLFMLTQPPPTTKECVCSLLVLLLFLRIDACVPIHPYSKYRIAIKKTRSTNFALLLACSATTSGKRSCNWKRKALNMASITYFIFPHYRRQLERKRISSLLASILVMWLGTGHQLQTTGDRKGWAKQRTKKIGGAKGCIYDLLGHQ